MRGLIHFLREEISKQPHEDITHFSPVHGTQYGSNPGGIFKHPTTDEKHYVKFYRNDQQARSEVAAAEIHKLLGSATVGPRLTSYSGNVALASKWNDNLEPISPHNLQNASGDDRRTLAKKFLTGVLTKDWDTVGLEHDNLMRDKNTRDIVSVDHGGAFRFRAMGSHKPYEGDITEFDSLRDPNYYDKTPSSSIPPSVGVFKQLKNEDLREHLPALKSLTFDNVHKIFKDVGLQDAEHHAKSLISRRDAIVSRVET